jgi:membrane fusion protein (multidrug efflux system)
MLGTKKFKIIAAILVLIILGLFFLFRSGNAAFTDNAYLKGDIVVIKPKVVGYITEVLVEDNSPVKAGQIIAKIDDRDYKLNLARYEAQLESVKAKIDMLNSQLSMQEYEVKQAISDQESARVSFEMADKNFKRSQRLIGNKAISQQTYDKDFEIQISSKNRYNSTSSKLEITGLKKSSILAELREAKASQIDSEASLEIAKIDLENTKIRAATDGVISKKSLQVGQLATSSMALGYLVQNNIWILANFKEVQIKKMQAGQQAIITIDSFPDKKFTGRIESLSPVTGAEFSILPPENATGNFTKIVQRVPVKIVFEQNQDLSLLKSGLSCEVKVMF